MFDVVAVSRTWLFVFTAYQNSQVGGAILTMKKLETIAFEENGRQMTIIFGFGSGNSVRVTETLERSGDLMTFARSAGDLAWR